MNAEKMFETLFLQNLFDYNEAVDSEEISFYK